MNAPIRPTIRSPISPNQTSPHRLAPYSFKTRFENEKGTNPEELIAAAHAGCFTMALAFGLQAGGYAPTELTGGRSREELPGLQGAQRCDHIGCKVDLRCRCGAAGGTLVAWRPDVRLWPSRKSPDVRVESEMRRIVLQNSKMR
jgi:OsmC-like protein